ncbi:MAG: hypothetical protein K8F30_06950 [Taibaiella sp.]|nr:hypothetical protein [Taibaiella sp.]
MNGKDMETITLEINDKEALKKLHVLEEKRLITIIRQITVDSPDLKGEPMSIKAFKKWIHVAENTPSISLKDAKAKWAKKRSSI